MSKLCEHNTLCPDDQEQFEAGVGNDLKKSGNAEAKASFPDKRAHSAFKREAFLELEASMLACSGNVDPDAERRQAMNEKFGIVD